MHTHIRVASFFLWCLAWACAAAIPAWYRPEPYGERLSAYEWLLVATASATGDLRAEACELAATQARDKLIRLLIDRSEAKPEIAAAVGGPSRLAAALTEYGRESSQTAIRTREEYQESGHRCFLELRWLLPRDLAADIRRVLAKPADERAVGVELRLALSPDHEERGPVSVPRTDALYPSPEAAVQASYPGWFVRVIQVPTCDTHRLAFAGTPGGSDGRWIDLKHTERGWLLVDDRSAPLEGWPSPPDLACD